MSTTIQTKPSVAHRTRHAAHKVRQTHTVVKSVVPVITTLVSLMGAVALAMEAFSGAKALEKDAAKAQRTKAIDLDDDEDDDLEDDEDEDADDAVYAPARYSFLAHLLTLAHYIVITLLGIVIVALLVMFAHLGGAVVTAVILTALVLFAIWATAHLSRRAS